MNDPRITARQLDSREKVQQQLDRLDTYDITELDPAGAAALGIALMMRDQLAALLPADPAELDALLARGAVWALSMRSDNARPMGLLPPVHGDATVIDADHGGVQ